MKKYVCDSCNKVIDDPFAARMTRFEFVPQYDCGCVYRLPMKNKIKIDLCENCFNGLKYIAEKKEGVE